ncbi:hypothetical protein TNCV_169301 [Trichonephila clavipes]|nr:hypothetical protein TNCV_169301 [Trichonephila clavipes]
MRGTPACGINPWKALRLVPLSEEYAQNSRIKTPGFRGPLFFPLSTILPPSPPSTPPSFGGSEDPLRENNPFSYSSCKSFPIPRHHFSPLILSSLSILKLWSSYDSFEYKKIGNWLASTTRQQRTEKRAQEGRKIIIKKIPNEIKKEKIKGGEKEREKIPQEKEEQEHGRVEKRSARASGIGRGREPREKTTQPSNALLLPDKVVSVIVVFTWP